MITSGGNQNPANADRGGRTGRRRFELFTVQACPTSATLNATDPWLGSQLVVGGTYPPGGGVNPVGGPGDRVGRVSGVIGTTDAHDSSGSSDRGDAGSWAPPCSPPSTGRTEAPCRRFCDMEGGPAAGVRRGSGGSS